MTNRTMTSRLVMEVVDRVTAPARAMSRSILGISEAVAGANGRSAAGFGARLTDAIDRNNAALDVARGRLFDAVAGFYALRSAIAAPIRSAIAFEDAMADVRKVVDFPTPESFQRFQQDLFALSREIPLTVQELAEIAAAAGEAGFALDELFDVTRDAAQIAVAFGVNAREAGQMLASMRQSYGMSREQALLLADAMNHLSNSMASSAPQLMEFWTRIAADAERAGFTQQEAVALGSAMIASGHGADVAATSFRAMIRALTRGESATDRQREAFTRMGFDVSDVARRMQEDAVGTTRQVLEAIGRMPAELQNSLMSDVFGDEARALGSIATNLAFFDRAIASVADSSAYAGSALREFEARSATTSAALTRFMNVVTQLSVAIGSALLPALASIAEAVSPVIIRIADLAAAFPGVTAGIVGAAAAIVGFKVAVAGLSFLGLMGRGGALSLLALGFNTVGRAAIGARTAATSMIGLQAALAGMSGQSVGTLARVSAGLRGIALAVPGVGPVMAFLGAISAPVWGTFAAIAGAIAAAGLLVWRYWERISAVFSGVSSAIGEALAPAFEAIRPVLEWFAPLGDAIAAGWSRLTGIFSGLGDLIGSVFSQESLTEDEAAAWEQWGHDIAESIISAITSIPTRIAGVVSLMYDAGMAFIQAFWDGMVAVFNQLVAWAESRVDAVVAPFRNAAATVRSYLPSFLGGTETGGGGVDGERAGGGPISRGGTYLVGEEGPELITAGRSGYVHTAGATAGMIGGGATINLGGVTINAPAGADPVQIAAMVRRELEDMTRAAFRGIQADAGMSPY